MTERSIVFLTGSREDSAVRVSSEKELDRVPTMDTESDGMGKAMGAVLGGAVGASAGLAGGAAMASLLVPGVGHNLCAGGGCCCGLGLGGAACGSEGWGCCRTCDGRCVPRDEVKFYHEVLRRGRSLVIANADGEELAERAQTVFKQQGGEDVETARKEFEKAA